MTHPQNPHDRTSRPENEPGEASSGERAELQEVNLSADLYKGTVDLKTLIRPNEGTPQPETWAEVGRSFNQSLMRIAAGLPGVVAEVLDGAIRICKGVASLPESIAQRVRGAQQSVDRREAERSESRSSQPIRRIDARDSEQALLDKVMQLQARGIPVQLQQRPDGVWIIVIVRPELTSTAHELGEEALSEHRRLIQPDANARASKTSQDFEDLLEEVPGDTDKQIARFWALGFSSDEIAKELGLTVDVVKTRWERTRDRLRDAFRDKYPDDDDSDEGKRSD